MPTLPMPPSQQIASRSQNAMPPCSKDSEAMRKKKNAEAQAAFRQRRDTYITILEVAVTNLESVVLDLQESCRRARNEAAELRLEASELRSEVTDLRDRNYQLVHALDTSRRPQSLQVGYQLATHATLQGAPTDIVSRLPDNTQYLSEGMREGPWSIASNVSSGSGFHDSSPEAPEEQPGFCDVHDDFHVDSVINPSGGFCHRQLSSSTPLARMQSSRSPSPSDEDGSFGTSSVKVMKTQAFGGLRRSRRVQKPSVDPDRYNAAMDVIEGYSISLNVVDDQPPRKRTRYDNNVEYCRPEDFIRG